jgi:integrase
MATRKGNDPFKRWKTRYKGITFRVLKDGSRRYGYYHAGTHINVVGGEKDALAAQAKARDKAARGEAPVAPSKATFGDVAEQWIESKRKLRAYTRKGYRDALDRILIPRLGQKKIGAITVEHVAALIRDLEREGLSSSTITNYLKPLNGTMTYALRRGLIGVNPCALLTADDRPREKESKPVHVWSDEELAALIESAESHAKQVAARYDYSALLRLASDTGLRLGELLGLRWEDFDREARVLHVRRQWTREAVYGPTKTNAGQRRIPISDQVVKFLTELRLRSDYSNDGDPVFASRKGTPLGHRNVTARGFEPAAKLAGIERVTFHDVRHAFASRMIARGISSTVLAKVMGHESSAITERIYVHLFDAVRTDEDVREAMAAR